MNGCNQEVKSGIGNTELDRLTLNTDYGKLIELLRSGDRVQDALSARAVEQLFFEREFFKAWTHEILFLSQKAMIEFVLSGREPLDYEYPDSMNEFKTCIRIKMVAPAHWQEKLEIVMRKYRNRLIQQKKYRWEIPIVEESACFTMKHGKDG